MVPRVTTTDLSNIFNTVANYRAERWRVDWNSVEPFIGGLDAGVSLVSFCGSQDARRPYSQDGCAPSCLFTCAIQSAKSASSVVVSKKLAIEKKELA
jgi:hypothetical protein